MQLAALVVTLALSLPQKSLQSTVEAVRARHDLPGLAVAIVRGGRLTDSAVVGVRNVQTAAALQIGDRFHIASCTKSMTAMLAALLVEEGLIRWNARLRDVLPELSRNIRAEYQSVTLEQLLAHAAWMPQYTMFGAERQAELQAIPGSPTQQRLRFLQQVLDNERANTGVGDAAYSNVGYTAAAAMLERAAGAPWEDLIASRIARPLKLNSFGLGWPATSRTPDQPRGHRRINGKLVPQPLDDTYVLPQVLWPGGAVHLSITDVARYAADHLNGLKARPALLPSAVYQRLHSTLNGEPTGFTLGWGVRPDSVSGRMHYGAGSGGTFFVRIYILPERDLAVVVAANGGDAAAATATREIAQLLLRQ